MRAMATRRGVSWRLILFVLILMVSSESRALRVRQGVWGCWAHSRVWELVLSWGRGRQIWVRIRGMQYCRGDVKLEGHMGVQNMLY